MAYEVYGNLDLHLGQLKNTKFEQVTTLPTASASEYGRLVHLVPDDIVYQCQKQGDNYVWRSLQIKKVSVAGGGNVVTDVSYDNTTDTLTITKGLNAVEQVIGKGLSTNDYTDAEKTKLAGIAAGAEVNQNAYANVKVGATTIAAGSKTDTIELVAGSNNVTITPDAANKKVTITVDDTDLSGYIPTSQKGANNGVATLDAQGKVPSTQLPSYVDDVIEGYYYNNKFYEEAAHTTEITPESGKIYVDLSTEKTYRWGGTAYVVISETLAIGETTGTAFEGSRGKTLEDKVDNTSAQNPTLSWGAEATLGTANGTTFKLTMPANPNTDTKVTSVDNHYTPETNDSAALSADSGKYVSGIKRDAKGHVTDIEQTSLPADTGATAVEETGSGNAVTGASYSAATRKITLTKGTTFLTSHQSLDDYVNTLNVTGTGNAITNITKSGKTLTATKGKVGTAVVYKTNPLTGSNGTISASTHGLSEIYSAEAYVAGKKVELDNLSIDDATMDVSWSSGSYSFTSSSVFVIKLIGL